MAKLCICDRVAHRRGADDLVWNGDAPVWAFEEAFALIDCDK